MSASPFVDFGNKYVLVGTSFSPSVLIHRTWSQIAAALRNPRGTIGQAILGSANYITAAICALTGDQPATVCTPTVRSLLSKEPPTSIAGVINLLPQASAAGN